jgi:hypothetical protein
MMSRQKVRVSRRRGAVLVEVALGALAARRMVADIYRLLRVDDLPLDPESVRIPLERQGLLSREAGGFPV